MESDNGTRPKQSNPPEPSMDPRPHSLTRIVLLALCLLCSTAALAQEETPYPIWWSPELGLESLELVDRKLQEEFPQARQFHVVKHDLKFNDSDTLVDEDQPERGYVTTWEYENEQEHLIKNCRTLIELTNKGFNAEEFDDRHLFNGWSEYCYALHALKTARPAQRSFVHTFGFDDRAMDYLPAMVVESWDCRSLKELLEANRQYISWTKFDHGWVKDPMYYRLIVKNSTAVLMERAFLDSPNNIISEYLVEIIGRGDFDGDGLEDLVINRQLRDPRFGGRSSTFYLVTRQGEDEVLRVVDFCGPMPMDSCSARKAIIRSGQEP